MSGGHSTPCDTTSEFGIDIPQEVSELTIEQADQLASVCVLEIPAKSDMALVLRLHIVNSLRQRGEAYTQQLSVALEDLGGVIFEHPELHEQFLGLAIRALREGETLAPKSSTRRCFYLGQILEGEEAAAYFKTGYGILRSRIFGDASVAADSETREQFADFGVALGELYMTDLCEHPDAQQIVEEVLTEAVAATDSAYLPPLVQACAYSRIIGDLDTAREEAAKAFALLQPALDAIAPRAQGVETRDGDMETRDGDMETRDGDMETRDRDMGDGDMGDGDMEELPDYEICLNLGRLGTDIGMHEDAIVLLKALLEINDEDGDFDEAEYCCDKARLHCVNNMDPEIKTEIQNLNQEIHRRRSSSTKN